MSCCFEWFRSRSERTAFVAAKVAKAMAFARAWAPACDVHVLVPHASMRAGYFPFGESNQSRCAGHDGLADVVSARLPLVLADRAPARTRTSLCSNMRALLARAAARRGVMQRRGFCFDDGHPWPRSKREQTTCFVLPRAHDVRKPGALEHDERATERDAQPHKCSGRAPGVGFSLLRASCPPPFGPPSAFSRVPDAREKGRDAEALERKHPMRKVIAR